MAPPPPARMAVVRLHAPGDLRLHEEPIPTPGDGEVLLRVTSVGLCGSDRHWFLHGSIGGTGIQAPLVLGHEFAGVVASGPDAGRRVVAEPAIPCGRCRTCLAGRPELCPTAGFAGYGGTDGALRTFTTWPAPLLVRLPGTDVIGDAEAALLEPLGIALHAIHLADLEPGATVAVLGAGPIGQLVVRALVAGVGGAADVSVAEPLAHRQALAVAAGARPVRAGDEPDVVMECAGEEAAVETAIELVRPGGRVVLVGIPGEDRTTFTASVARRKGLTLQLCRRMRPGDLAEAVALVGAGTVGLDGLVSHILPLTEVGAAFGHLTRRDGHKIVVRP